MKAKITTRFVNVLGPKEKPYEIFDTETTGFLLRVEPTGVMTYYLAYKTNEGKRRRYRIGRHGQLKVAGARDLAEKYAAKVVGGTDIQEEKKEKRFEAERAKFKKLKGFLDHKYGPWVMEHRKTGEATLKRIRFNFSQFLDRPLSEINAWVIEKWRSEQLKQGKSKSTVNRDVVALKAALSKAVEWEIIDENPLAKIKPLKTDTKGKVRYLTEKEEIRLRVALVARDEEIRRGRESGNRWRRERGYAELPDLSNCQYADHLTPMVLLTLNTGIRRGEAFDLTWDNVNFHICTLTAEGHTAKSGHTRHIPLNEEAVEVLKAWKKQSDGAGLVFPGKDGKRLDNVQTSWSSLLKSAGISSFRWHDMRHDFASKLVMAGAPLNTVRELLGHADLTTTLRYAHLAPDHKAEAVAMINRNRQG